MGDYLTQLPGLSFATGVFGGSDWLNSWTIFYWAWWISWTPFVGMFIARISKGRTIRQFVIYVVLVPSLVSFIWFSILGGTAIDLQLNQGWDPPTTGGAIALEESLFDTLREFPLSGITVALAVFLVAIFFVTGADAASIVMGMLSQNGKEEPFRWLVIFWGVATGAVAAVLLLGWRTVGAADTRDHRRRAVHADPDRDVRVLDEGAAPGVVRVDAALAGAPRGRARPAVPGRSLTRQTRQIRRPRRPASVPLDGRGPSDTHLGCSRIAQ